MNNRLYKSFQGSLRLDHVGIRLGPSVEYGAVSRGADDLLVEGSLAPLALRPELGEGCLARRGFLRNPQINPRLVLPAVDAGGLARLSLHGNPTPQARGDLLDKRRHGPRERGRGDADLPGVLA